MKTNIARLPLNVTKPKPIIGLVGGIGSGKSFVARLFGDEGCVVVDSDAQVTEAYRNASVIGALNDRWGDEIFRADGSFDRGFIARKIFSNPIDRRWLEGLIHPLVNQAREALMRFHADDPQVKAFVWDTPLLIETGLADRCDAIVFIDAPVDLRVARVRQTRGWDESDLLRRQNLQHPLDNKRAIADHVIENSADVGVVRNQVRDVLSRILNVF